MVFVIYVFMYLVALVVAGIGAIAMAYDYVSWRPFWLGLWGLIFFVVIAGIGTLILRWLIPANQSAFTNKSVQAMMRGLVGFLTFGTDPYHLSGRIIRQFYCALSSPFRKMREGAGEGLGGSARFANLFEEWEKLYAPTLDRLRYGEIVLGQSLFDEKAIIGHADDRGLITVANPRTGKGISAIIPNLKRWPGGALVIDPKGENAFFTARVQRRYPSYVIDPFGIYEDDQRILENKASGMRGQTGQRERRWTHCLNPLDDIDPNSLTINEDLAKLADALVVPDGDPKSQHFEDGARRLLSACIGHLLTTTKNPKLPDILGMISRIQTGDSELLVAMMNNPACNGMIRQGAISVQERTQEARNFISNALKNTEWLFSTSMQETLSRSDFSLTDLRTKRITVYLVLPPDKLENHKRFLRLFINLSLKAMSQPGHVKQPVLFVLDEFYALGRMNELSKTAALLPGYGVKLWPIVQNIGQLKELYPDNWETFMTGGMQQYFGVSDTGTLNYIAHSLGEKGFKRNSDQEHQLSTSLLSTEEIRKRISRETGNQIIIRADRAPFLLKRLEDKGQRISEEDRQRYAIDWRNAPREPQDFHFKREALVPYPERDSAKENHFFQHVENFIQHAKLRSRMRPEKAKINETEELLQVVQDDLWACIKARDYGGEADRIRVKYERTLQPGYVMEKFKRVVENPDVKAILNEFPEAMKPGNFCLHHAGDINRIFDRAACLLPLAEIMDMADYIASNDVLRLSASIDYGFCYARDDVFHGMGELLKRCPIENKLELYAKLETSGYLEDRMPKQSASKVVYFVADAFEGIETETAVSVLRSSKAWRSVKKDKLLCDWVIDRDKRLLPVLEDVEESSKTEEARQEEPEKKPEPEAEPEEAGEGIRSEAQQEQERRAESRYSPEQDAAWRRFYLPEGFTLEQLKARYTELAERLAVDQIDQLTADYNILLSVVKDEAEDEDKKD